MKKIILLGTVFIYWLQFNYSQSQVTPSIITNGIVTVDFGNALQFDGINDYVNAGVRPNLQMSNALTIEAWIFPKGVGSATYEGGIITSREGEYEIARFADGTIRFALANSYPGWTWINTRYIARLNVWTHISFTYSASEGIIKLYADGIEVFSSSASGDIGDIGISENYDELWIAGRQFENGEGVHHANFNGVIDEVRVWNKALSQLEIKEWMRKPVTSSHPEFSHLAGYWTFDEGQDISTTDVSGHGNTGTLINSPKWITSTIPINILTFYADKDRDGFGDAGSTIESYSAPAGYLVNNTDCNDSRASIHPNATELCNGIDENCNGQIDEQCVQPKDPTVKITSPVNGASYTALATIILSADASDVDGTVKTVGFYNGSTLIFTEDWPPFYRKWLHVPVGDYSLTAKATDNNGNTTTSSVVHVSVVPNQAPVVKITSPANGASSSSPATIQLTAEANDVDGTIKTVDFYNGNSLLFTEKYMPYSRSWFDVPGGNYSITAIATDNNGKKTTSAPVVVNVTNTISVGALSFDGVNDYVSITNNDVLKPSSQITIEAWIKPTNIHSNRYYEIYRKEDDYEARHLFSFQEYGTILSFGLKVGGNYTELDVQISPSDYEGKWVHVAATFDGSTKKIYRNNILIGSENITGQIATTGTSPSLIGSYIGQQEFFNGIIDEVRVWKRALNLAEIEHNMNCELALPQTSLIAYYKFNQGLNGGINTGATSLTDQSGNHLNGTLNNFALTGLTSNWVGGKVADTCTAYLAAKSAGNALQFDAASLNSKTNIRHAVRLQLVPNPAKNVLNIYTAGLQKNKQLIVSIISASGVTMKTKQSSSSTETIQLNVLSLRSGVYTIKIVSGDKILYRQFVKL